MWPSDKIEWRLSIAEWLAAMFVLVVSNLLREGLDRPECGLVAILNADKEGFLRSETSLIQTNGRAAQRRRPGDPLRRQRYRLIERALNETDPRPEKQEEYNRLHGITPRRSSAIPATSSPMSRPATAWWSTPAIPTPRTSSATICAPTSATWTSACARPPPTSSWRKPPACETRSASWRKTNSASPTTSASRRGWAIRPKASRARARRGSGKRSASSAAAAVEQLKLVSHLGHL